MLVLTQGTNPLGLNARDVVASCQHSKAGDPVTFGTVRLTCAYCLDVHLREPDINIFTFGVTFRCKAVYHLPPLALIGTHGSEPTNSN